MKDAKYIFRGVILLAVLILQFCSVWAANSEVFFIAHTFDPNSHHDYKNWKASAWNDWLDKQEVKRAHANKNHGTPLTSKGINTVLIGSKKAILDSFDPKHGDTPKYQGKFHWSNKKFATVVFEISAKGRRVFLTPELYAAAALNKKNQPKHLATTFDSRPKSGNAMFAFSRNGKLIQ